MSRLLVVLLCLSAISVYAQEIDCTVQVNYEGVPTTNRELLQNLGADLRDYVNNYQWGSEKLEEKIKVSLNVFVQSVVGENRYSAQVFVGSQRTILGAKKNTAVLRILDDGWEFTYLKDRPINHNPMMFNDLASFLDFYMYLVIGHDYDTYEVMAGAPWFQKASDVVRVGTSSGQKGWQLVTTGYSRAQYLNDLLTPTMEPLRRGSYVYHFSGLDSMTANPARGYANILRALEIIGIARKNSDPRNLAVKTFFDTKYLEIADVFLGYGDRYIYLTLTKIDPFHQKTYDEYRMKK